MKLPIRQKCNRVEREALQGCTSLVGIAVQAIAGHDKGRYYLVIDLVERADDLYGVWLVDGEHHPLANAKLKSLKHIRPIQPLYSLEQVEQLRTDFAELCQKDTSFTWQREAKKKRTKLPKSAPKSYLDSEIRRALEQLR